MDPTIIAAIAVLMMLGAALYTSVGHAGASAYLAIMALFSVAPTAMKPTALVLNILVASFSTFRFVRAGQFNGKLLIPFVIGAVPAAFFAGRAHLPGHFYKPIVAVLLLLAAIRMLWRRPSMVRVPFGTSMRSAAETFTSSRFFEAIWFGPFISASKMRSEEHTSELQSRRYISYAVFCL